MTREQAMVRNKEPERCECTDHKCPIHFWREACGNVAEVVVQVGEDTAERYKSCRACAENAVAETGEGREFDSIVIVRTLVK